MTDRPLHILGISGSLRQGSYNTALLRSAAEAMPPSMLLTIGEISDLPLYNRDVEVQGLPEPVQRIRAQLADADAVLFACPEYNWSLTGALKNAIDWLSRNPASPLDHKPAAIIGGGGRGGGARAQAHLREVLAHNRVPVYEASEVVIPAIWKAFDDDLHLVDEQAFADLRTLVGGFEADVRRDQAHRPAVLAIGSDAAALAGAYRALIADYRVVLAVDDDGVQRQIERWAPGVVVFDQVVGTGSVGGVPVVPIGDPAMLRESVAEALEQ